MKHFLTLALLIVLASSCKNDKNTTPPIDQRSSYEIALDNFNTKKDASSARAYIVEIQKELSNIDEPTKRLNLLTKGLNTAEEYKQGSSAVGFLMALLRDHSRENTKESYLAKLTSALLDLGQEVPGNILAKSYLEQYPSGQHSEIIVSKKTSDIDDLKKHLNALKASSLEDPDKNGMNRKAAQKYVDACEALALGFPEHPESPKQLYSAAEIARTIETYGKAISLFDWISSKYPNYEKAPEALFVKASILDDNFQDNEVAVKYYNEFITKYPEHQLVESAKFLVENIDKTTEEMMQIILERAKAKKQAQ